jgi:glutamyl-tRNA reductase
VFFVPVFLVMALGYLAGWKVGFIGLGHMGAGMAANLLRAGQ